MPVKARYWKDPEKHRKECRVRKGRLAAIGSTWKSYLTTAVYEKRRLYQNAYVKAHRVANSKACQNYRLRIIRLFGTCAKRDVWRYKMLIAEKRAKIVKFRAKNP